ncbi:PFOR [Symbiodinium sp. CCMP2592]|nr:PFOR [Symbiodinium sp. CCMP2592]
MATRQRDVIQLVASECNSFAERFFSEHRRYFEELTSGEVGSGEQKAEWFQVFKRFEAEAELTVQNALMLWGAVQAKTFEQEFIEAAMQSDALNDYLSLTEYPMFVKRMWREVQAKRERDAKLGEDRVASPKFCRQTSNRSLGDAKRRTVQQAVTASPSQCQSFEFCQGCDPLCFDDRMWRLWTCSRRVKASSLTWAKADDTYGGQHRFGTLGRTGPAIGRD